MLEVIPDLKIIYRPFGFIKWAENFQYVSQKKLSNKDLLLIGTGNVGKFCINYKKPIRIAQYKIPISYFNYNIKFKSIWDNLSSEKLIFREIAKNPTFVYDPGILTNITGLYFIRIPSYSTENLLSLLLILNSNLITLVFKTLFSTLHMAGNYLRINGSFIKRLPLPEVILPDVSELAKILQFLYQLNYDLKLNNRVYSFYKDKVPFLETLIHFFDKLSNSIVNITYFNRSISHKFEKLVNSMNVLPNFYLKLFFQGFDLPEYIVYQEKEIKSIFNSIVDVYKHFNKNSLLLNQIKHTNEIMSF